MYINDLTDNISSEMRLFADDASLFTCVKGVTQNHDKLRFVDCYSVGLPVENGFQP